MNKILRKLHHYFVPHEGNDFKAHVFRETSLGILFLIVIVTFVAGVGQKYTLIKTDYLAAVYSGVLVDLANEDRTKNSLPPLSINPILETAAQLKAVDMATKGYFAHYGPDGSAPWDWMRKAGYQFIYAGENLAVDFTDSEDVNEAWLKSPTHRANIMSSKFTEIGIATIKGKFNGHDTIYVVQMFGTPQQVAAQTLPIVSPVPVNQLAQNTETEGSPEVQGAAASQSVAKPTTTKPIATSTLTKSSVDNIPNESFIAIENSGSSTVAGPIITNNTPGVSDNGLVEALKNVSTNPQKTMAIVYGIASLILVIGLIAMIRKDLQIHHLKHALGGVFLMVIIVTLTYVYNHAVFSDTIIVAVNSL